jgi:hypothetical protein
MEIISSVIGVLLGGGILAFIQFLITRHDTRHDRLKTVTESIETLKTGMNERFDTLDSKIDAVEAKTDKYYAVSSRVRILRFEDELQEKRKHSKDSWDQAMSDIDYYENYCQAHPKFKNNQTVATVEHIKNGYMERLEKHDWSY